MDRLGVKRDVVVWWGVGILLFLCLWWFSEVVFPFALGFVFAYVLRPLAVRLERDVGMNASLSAFLLTVFVFIFIFGALTVGFPLLVRELALFAQGLPEVFDRFEGMWSYWRDEFLFFSERLELDVVGLVKSHMLEGVRIVLTSLLSVASGISAFLGLVSLVVLTPIAGFYFLRDWDRVLLVLEGWIPLKSRSSVMLFMGDVDKRMSAFVRGQLSVSMVLSLYYGVTLSVLGVKFGLLLGIVTGVLSLLPYVGFTLGFLLTCIFSFLQFYGGGEDWLLWMGIVVVVMVVGQVCEGFVLGPWLIGKEVELHALWLIFSLVVGGSVGGVMGVMIAVPFFLVLREGLRVLGERYRGSTLYREEEER